MNNIRLLERVANKSRRGYFSNVYNDIRKNKYLYIMLVPVILYYLLFHYKPMYGALIAFKDFDPMQGILKSQWVGFDNFKQFFSSYLFLRLLKNTFLISLYSLLFSFPAPIILALMINEVNNRVFKRVVQSLTYAPYFISMIVVCGLISQFVSERGLINDIIAFFGGQRVSMLLMPGCFRSIYVISGIWQMAGWNSIIYLATLTTIDNEQYEASRIDGAGKFKQLIHITLPGIKPTIVIMFILAVGNMMNVGFEKIILLYNPSVYDTADVISSYVYRKGIQDFSYSFSAAVGLFNSVINLVLVISSNWLSKKVNETSLW